MPGKLFLVRHAETKWHEHDRNLGLNDIELSLTGRSKATQLAKALAPVSFGQIVHSPLQRAEETARIIADGATSPLSLQEANGLIDLDIGEWQGLEHSVLNARSDFQAFIADPHTNLIPGGERLSAARDRAMKVIRNLETTFSLQENLLVVTHADIIRLIFTDFLCIAPGNYFRFVVATSSVSVIDRCTKRLEMSNWTSGPF
jgi:probable phosphoglycerate mutase